MESPASTTQRIREILDLALERPIAERAAFVDGACAGEPALRDEVCSLLEALDAAGDLLEPQVPARADEPEPLTGLAFGPYTVQRRIGAGGMGVVYEALDARLGRTVAVKALPPAFAADPHRRARFEQEARLLAAINHPNIAAIYGIEDTPRGPMIVLEHVAGPTLAELLTRGALPLRESIRIAAQIARALEAAHASGIMHRDLKPSNIRFRGHAGDGDDPPTTHPDASVKVLDFGIAKPLRPIPAAGDAPHTRQGDIMGTAAYMSPEQARGQGVDRRADLWAFGCVLFEMLTGRRAFGGATSSDTLAALLSAEPDWSALPAAAPPALHRLLRRCLAKDADHRLRDAGDARLELESAIAELDAPPTPRMRRLPLAAPLLAAACCALAAALLWQLLSRPVTPQTPRVVRFSLSVPDVRTLSGTNPALAAASGALALVAVEGDSSRLFLLAPNSLELVAIPGSQDAASPFPSPDGKWFAFFNAGTGALQKVPLNGGSPVTIATTQTNAFGGLWLDDGTIIYSVMWKPGLHQVRPGAARGEPIKADSIAALTPYATDEVPGTPWLLITTRTIERGGLMCGVDLFNRLTGERRPLISRGSDARLLGESLVFARDGGLAGVRFDAATLSLAGTPVALVDTVSMWSGAGPAYAAISRAGDLVYAPGPLRDREGLLAWVSRSGEVAPLLQDDRTFHDPTLSRDGHLLAVSVQDQTADLCIIDLRRPSPALVRITTGIDCYYHVWSRDMRSIYFLGIPAGTHTAAFYRVPADGSGPPQRLPGSASGRPHSVSPDDRFLLYSRAGANASDLVLLSVEDGSERDFIATPGDEIWGMFSPDGGWVAYSSEEFGKHEVYIAPYPGPGPRVRVSTSGGYRPRWSGSGDELFYQWADQLWAVDVDLHASAPVVGPARKLFEGRFVARYDADISGQRFIAPLDTGHDSPLNRLHIVVNWAEEVRKKLSP